MPAHVYSARHVFPGHKAADLLDRLRAVARDFTRQHETVHPRDAGTANMQQWPRQEKDALDSLYGLITGLECNGISSIKSLSTQLRELTEVIPQLKEVVRHIRRNRKWYETPDDEKQNLEYLTERMLEKVRAQRERFEARSRDAAPELPR